MHSQKCLGLGNFTKISCQNGKAHEQAVDIVFTQTVGTEVFETCSMVPTKGRSMAPVVPFESIDDFENFIKYNMDYSNYGKGQWVLMKILEK